MCLKSYFPRNLGDESAIPRQLPEAIGSQGSVLFSCAVSVRSLLGFPRSLSNRIWAASVGRRSVAITEPSTNPLPTLYQLVEDDDLTIRVNQQICTHEKPWQNIAENVIEASRKRTKSFRLPNSCLFGWARLGPAPTTRWRAIKVR